LRSRSCAISRPVITAWARTPFQPAQSGALAAIRADDLAAVAIAELIARSGIEPSAVEDVLLGCACQAPQQSSDVARTAALLARLPVEVGGLTVNRSAGSSMAAIHIAAANIVMGAGAAFVCGGVDSMSGWQLHGTGQVPNRRVLEAYAAMSAEAIAQRHGISRADQERFARSSHQKAAAAQLEGRLAQELVAVRTMSGLVDTDGCIRPSSREDLSVTTQLAEDATTSAPAADGAAAVLVVSDACASSYGADILARIRSVAVCGCAPDNAGMAAVPATQKALERAGLTIADIDVVELDEVFASQALACLRELNIPPEKVNLDGGAIALGNPEGATGARITAKAAQIMRRGGKAFALAAQSIRGGQGIAIVLEAV